MTKFFGKYRSSMRLNSIGQRMVRYERNDNKAVLQPFPRLRMSCPIRPGKVGRAAG